MVQVPPDALRVLAPSPPAAPDAAADDARRRPPPSEPVTAGRTPR